LQTRKFAALQSAIGAVLFGGAGLVALHYWAGLGGPDFHTALGFTYDAVVVCAGVACLLRASRGGRERPAWLVIAAAVFAWAAAEVYWTLYIEGNAGAPYPSPADIGYLAFYPLAVAGLYLLVRAHADRLDPRLWMDGAIAALGTAALGAALVFEFVADRTSGNALQVATTLAYPLGDVVLLALAVGVIALTRWHPGRTWSLLLAGLAAMAVADVAFTFQSYEAALPGGDWVEPLYMLSAVLIGAEAWAPEAATIQPEGRFDGLREVIVPAIVAMTMVALVAMQYFAHASALTTALWSATMLAVVGRLALSVRANKRLLELVRTDPLTGLGSQGRLQMDLRQRDAGASDKPLTVMLFDLNGFKHYNDTFGHPAGDKMLGLLGSRLGTAVGAEATAYRLGGDEFLVLAEGGLVDLGPARDALALSAAWGIASVPEEAASPAEAMQLADARMYAQKESRRLASSIPMPDGEAVEQRH
jgi:two-component system cell cycle response regulator